MSKNSSEDFKAEIEEIKKQIKEIDVELHKNKNDEREAIKKVEACFDQKRDEILKRNWKLRAEKHKLEERCPNLSAHMKAQEKHHRSGSAFTCSVCGYHIHECDERL